MRDEWTNGISNADANDNSTSDSRSSRGLTRSDDARYSESGSGSSNSSAGLGGLDRSASLTLAHKSSRGMRLKNREVSARKMVGDAEDLVNSQTTVTEKGGAQPWWRNVGMDEGL